MDRNRVIAAMSGGVDSSLTAALLVEQGFDVIGVTMQVWPEMSPAEEARRGGCCSLSAVDDARAVAHQLGIPYYVLNMREVFEENVIDYFTEEYLLGRTPNPCIACNRFVKFEALLEKAFQLNAHYVATGHYARITHDEEQDRYLLWRSADPGKDQTYALYSFRQDQLRHTLMPLGGYTKDVTRQMAAERGLVTADKPDSQEICFVLDNDYGAFIEEKAPHRMVAGPIVDTRGQVLGEHEGLARYTIGQRRGLGISTGEKLYVVDIDAPRNCLVVGGAHEVLSGGLVAGDVNWIAFTDLQQPRQTTAQIRYNGQPVPARIEPLKDGGVRVLFDDPQRAVTPGQAVVFYDDDLVLGGGTISSAIRRAAVADMVRA